MSRTAGYSRSSRSRVSFQRAGFVDGDEPPLFLQLEDFHITSSTSIAASQHNSCDQQFVFGTKSSRMWTFRGTLWEELELSLQRKEWSLCHDMNNYYSENHCFTFRVPPKRWDDSFNIRYFLNVHVWYLIALHCSTPINLLLWLEFIPIFRFLPMKSSWVQFLAMLNTTFLLVKQYHVDEYHVDDWCHF